MKRIVKYYHGSQIPEGAKFLHTEEEQDGWGEWYTQQRPRGGLFGGYDSFKVRNSKHRTVFYYEVEYPDEK